MEINQYFPSRGDRVVCDINTTADQRVLGDTGACPARVELSPEWKGGGDIDGICHESGIASSPELDYLHYMTKGGELEYIGCLMAAEQAGRTKPAVPLLSWAIVA